MDELEQLARDLAAAPQKVRAEAAKVLIATGEKVAATQRERTRSSSTRDKITVRPDRRGSRGGAESFSVHVGPSYTDTDDPNLPWIEEYGTSRQAPHPFITGSVDPHVDRMVSGLADVIASGL